MTCVFNIEEYYLKANFLINFLQIQEIRVTLARRSKSHLDSKEAILKRPSAFLML